MTHNAPEFRHPDEMEWEMGRFRNVTKFLFHPTPERPTVPNAGFLRYEPGAAFPCTSTTSRRSGTSSRRVPDGRQKYGPGTMVYMEDPHYENEMRTETGGTVLFVQYPGPTTGGRPHATLRRRRHWVPMQPRNLPAHSSVSRELTLLRALGVSLRTVRYRPGKRPPALSPAPQAGQELLPMARRPQLGGVPAAAAVRTVRGNSSP